MKPNFFLPVLLVVFLAGSAIATGQDQNEKKIERLQRKIEKQTKKLQELTGDEAHFYMKAAPAIKAEEIEKIKKEALAQAKESREQVREVMEAQREAMREQREAMMDQKRELENQMIIIREKNLGKLKDLKELKELRELDDLEESEIEVLKDIDGKKFQYSFKTPNWRSVDGEVKVFASPDVKIDIPNMKSGVYSIYSGDQDNLSINKELTDESSSADFYYEVKEGAEGMNLHVNGSMEAGKVTIVIKKPDGELFNEYTLSPLANVNWNQNINFGDDEADKYTGKWTVTVTADKAKGKYSLVIRERN